MKKIILLGIALSALASCQKSEELSTAEQTSAAVTFTSEVSTRVADTTWETGDEIGIFMYELANSETYNRYGTNARYYISSGAETTSAKFTSDNPLYYPQNSFMDFVAYYPYAEDTESSVPFTVGSTDQSSEEKLKALDLMVARAANCHDGSSPTLSFERKMSKVVFNVNIKDTAKDAELTDFTLSNVISGGTYTIYNTSNANYTKVTADTTTSAISLFLNDSDQVEAIVPPHTATDAKIAFSVDGDTYYGTLSETFEAGMQYTYNFTIGQNEVELSGVTISDWSKVESGEMGTEQIRYAASEISASNIPSVDTWIITDSGEITSTLMAGVVEALSSAYDSGREISILMPNATSIGSYIFDSCKALISIELPEATSIGYRLFYGCSALTSIELPKATSIGQRAFYGCSALTSIELPEATSIGMEAFCYCYKLTSIELPEAISIGVVAFQDCSSLTTLKLTAVSQITCGGLVLCNVNTSNITLYICQINNNVTNLTDGTYTFKEIIYID